MSETSESNWLQPLCDQFQRSMFTLNHDKPEDFLRSQWQIDERSKFWVMYRWGLAAMYIVGFLGSLIEHYNSGTWFAYLTDWSLTLSTYTCTFGAVISSMYYKEWGSFEQGSKSLKIYWASHYASTVMSISTTTFYWSSIDPSLPDLPKQFFNIFKNAVNCGLMVFDMSVVGFPTRLLHFIYPAFVGLTYSFFSILYYLAGGTDSEGKDYIYIFLDWAKAGIAIACIIIAFILLIIFCIAVFFIYLLRKFVYERYVAPKRAQRRQQQLQRDYETYY